MRPLALIAAVLLVLAAWPGASGPPSTVDVEARVTSGDPIEILAADPDGFGTDEVIYTWVSADEFRSTWDDPFRHTDDGFWTDAPLGVVAFAMRAPLHLPAGALIVGYSVVHEDSSAGLNLSARLEANYVLAGTRGSTTIGPVFQSSGAPGIVTSYVDVSPDHTVRYVAGPQLQSYAFHVALGGALDLQFRGMIVNWYRQVSPAPASATFNDVPIGHWAFQHIEALADSGITAGCGGGAYCPDSPLTRAQMAVFLAKALGLHYDH